ncbi:amidohydrolase family protein [Chloroflexota bacterium]
MPRIIDVHCHPFTKTGWKSLGKLRVHLERYLYKKEDATPESTTAEAPTEEEWAQEYIKNGVVAMPVAWDAESAMGESGPDAIYEQTTNDYIADLVKRFPDAIITGWGSVDPWKGVRALEEIERCIKELKLIGIKYQQTAQAFHVNDHRFYPMWDLCQNLGAPVQFHTGYTGLGGGAPGGLGIKLRYAMNIIPDVDDVAADFPKLKIIMLHPAEGRDDDAVLVCRHKGNVYREISGMWPRYIPESAPRLWYEQNRRLQDKIMFGSEYNLFPLDRIIEQHKQLEYRPGILEKLFYKNAVRILGEELERVGVDLKEWE